MPAPSPIDVLDLSGKWRAGIADEDLRRSWYTDGFDDGGFVDVTVPGHWRGEAPFADNDEPLLYRRRFTTLTPGAHTRAWLELDGVCAQGDVWLDEAYLGNTDGAWVHHSFEVTDALRTRNDHVLGIEVTSPPVGDRAAKTGLLGTWQDGPYVAPGWNPGGIWRRVELRRTGPVAVTAHRVLCTAATAERATVTVTCTIDSLATATVTIRTRVGAVEDVRTQPLAKGTNTVTWSVDVLEPALWWPRDLGGQPLTDVRVTVSDGADTSASPSAFTPSDQFTTRCGLRAVALRDWILTVNGERLFVKGVLVGPAAHELGTAPDEVFTRQVTRAADVGCNLIRIHGHVSTDALYAEADRTGMLVWQDLPLYRGQNRSVRRTALHTVDAMVDRLGAHPSIAVWCGHDDPDDVDAAAATTGFGRRLLAHQLPNWSRSVLDRSVKRAFTAADPSRPVIGSSGTWPHPPALAGTDTHLNLGWSAGEPEDLARIARAVPRAVRFVQITPGPSSTRPPSGRLATTWPPERVEALVGESPVDTEVLEARLPPKAFDSAEEWHRATLNYQSFLVATQIETLRRLKYRPTGGFTVAYLADLVPAVSPSLVDHTDTAKPAYAALRAACAPVLVTIDGWPGCAHAGDRVDCTIHVVNDTRAELTDAVLEVRLDWTGGGEHWKFGGTVDADSVGRVGRIRLDVPGGIDRIDATLGLVWPGGATTAHRTVPVHVHDDAER